MEQVFGVLVFGVGAAAVLALMFSGWWGGWGWWGDRGDVSQTVTVNVDAGRATEGANAVALAALAVLARQGQAQATAPQFAAPPTWAWDAEQRLWQLPQPDGSLLLSDGRAVWREAIPQREMPRITVMGRAVEAPLHWMDSDEVGLNAERDAADNLSRRLPAPQGR